MYSNKINTGALYAKIHLLVELVVDKMRHDVKVAHKKKAQSKGDSTPTGILTWLVRNGFILDVVDFLLIYGVDPKIDPTENLHKVAAEWIELDEYINTNDDAGVPTKISEFWKRINSASVFSAGEQPKKKGASAKKVKSRYDAIRTQERNLGKDDITRRKKGHTLPIMFACYTAYLCQEIINKADKIEPSLFNGEYVGNVSGTTKNRYNCIRMKDTNWDFDSFHLRKNYLKPVRFSDIGRLFFQHNVRKTLRDEQKKKYKGDIVNVQLHLNQWINAGWSLEIMQHYDDDEEVEDKKEKKNAAKEKQEKYNENSDILQGLLVLCNDEVLKTTPEKYADLVYNYCKSQANEAGLALHELTTVGRELKKQAKAKRKNDEEPMELNYGDGSLELVSPTVKQITKNFLNRHDQQKGINLAKERLPMKEPVKLATGMNVAELEAILDDHNIGYRRRQGGTEDDFEVVVLTKYKNAMDGMFNGAHSGTNEKVTELQDQWNCQGREIDGTKWVYRITRKSATIESPSRKRKDPPGNEMPSGNPRKKTRKWKIQM